MAVAALQVQALIVALLGVVFVSVTHASAVMRPTQAEPWGSKKLSDNARGFGLQRGCPMLLARPKRALIGGWGGLARIEWREGLRFGGAALRLPWGHHRAYFQLAGG